MKKDDIAFAIYAEHKAGRMAVMSNVDPVQLTELLFMSITHNDEVRHAVIQAALTYLALNVTPEDVAATIGRLQQQDAIREEMNVHPAITLPLPRPSKYKS